MQIEIRKLSENDFYFIASTMLDQQCSLRNFGRCPRRFMKQGITQRLKKIIESSTVMIACSSEDANQILGYLIYENDILHFVYTKMIYRNFGIMKKLIGDKKFELYTFNSEDKIFNEFIKKKRMYLKRN
jgi:hypothetical protein